MAAQDTAPQLTHLDDQGNAHMVSVGDKPDTERVAVASARVRMAPATLAAITSSDVPKGDVFAVARIAGIQAAKQCGNLIPLCHPLMLTAISIDFQTDSALPGVRVEARCALVGKTGVEMEALCAASVAALTIYDMCKALDRAMVVEAVQLESKSGGRSGEWTRPTE